VQPVQCAMPIEDQATVRELFENKVFLFVAEKPF
jgi:hypothetical protein